MQLDHPNQSTKILFLNQRVVDLFQGKISNIGKDLFGNHDFRISLKNATHTFCNDFTNILMLQLYFKPYIYYVTLCFLFLDWYCVTNISFFYSWKFVIQSYEQCPFLYHI